MKKHFKIQTLTAGVVAVFALALGAVYSPQASAVAWKTCTWTGAGGDNKFSTAANWSGCEGGAPIDHDKIRFASAPASDTNLINDLGVKLGGVINKASAYDPNAGSYIIDKLDFWGDADLSVERGASCSERSVVGLSSMNITSVGDLTDHGVMKLQDSKYTVAGNLSIGYRSFESNDLSGNSKADRLTMMTPTKYTTATGCPSGGLGGGFGVVSNIDYNSLTVQKGATFSLYSGFSKPITFGGGSGSDPLIAFSSETPGAKTYKWTSSVKLLSNADVYPGEDITVEFKGAIDGAGFSLNKSTSAPGKFISKPTSNNSGSQTGNITNPVKTTKLKGKVNESVTVVDKETAILLGERRYIQVQNGGMLKGTGFVREGLYVSKGGKVAPGMSPGCLTVGNITLDGTYDLEIGGKKACSQYDQIKVTGVNTPGVNSVEINKSASLKIHGLNDFELSTGDKFVIIDNRSNQPVKGAFGGLAEGARLNVGDVVFSVSYKGGDGNDVELTVLRGAKLPQRPNAGIAQLVSANPVIVAVTGVLAALAVLVLVRKKQHQS